MITVKFEIIPPLLSTRKPNGSEIDDQRCSAQEDDCAENGQNNETMVSSVALGNHIVRVSSAAPHDVWSLIDDLLLFEFDC